MGPQINTPNARVSPTIGVRIDRRVQVIGLFLIGGCVLASGNAMTHIKPARSALTRFTYTEYHMGVDARLVVYARDKTVAEGACAAAFERIAELDTMMSDYRPTSELMRLCDRAGGQAVKVSPELFKVLAFGQRVSRKSGGMFDVTVGPLVLLWRKARKSGVLPPQREIKRARALVGWRKIRLDQGAGTVRLLVPGMKLDLGGIAKGYADDEAQIVLKKHGISRALVEMGGDIVVSDPPPGTTGWTIRVPNAGSPDIQLSNRAISTSGDTEQFVVIGGVRYSHVINPLTGQALTNRVEGTVVAANGLTSDPLSKLPSLLGRKALARLRKAYPTAKWYVRVLGAK